MMWPTNKYATVVFGVAFTTLTLMTGACDEKPAKQQTPDASKTAAKKPEPEPRHMPQVTVTNESINIGIDSLAWNVPSFDKFYEAKLKKFPISMPSVVICNIDRKVKTPRATKAIRGLFDAGAKSVEVRTKPRGTFPGKLIVTPQRAMEGEKIPGCTTVAIIQDNLKATFWHVRGGLAKMYTKGMAGPDLSVMHEVLFKESSTCHSTVLFFSAQKDVNWGHAFDLAVSFAAHEPPYEINKYVLLDKDPVPGKRLKIGK